MLAEQLNAELSMVHVVPAVTEQNLEQSLRAAILGMKRRTGARQWRFGPAPNVAVRAGNPRRLLLDTISELQPDLVIVGPHSKRAVRDVLEGTLTERLLSARQCPLLLVRNPVVQPYRDVLLALDLSDVFDAAVKAGEVLTAGSMEHATILHAHESPYQGMLSYAGVDMDKADACMQDARREAAAKVRDRLSQQVSDPSRYEVVIADAHPIPAILRTAKAFRPDLLVLGTNGRGRIRRALLGSVASRLLHAVDCDVLIVPAVADTADTDVAVDISKRSASAGVGRRSDRRSAAS